MAQIPSEDDLRRYAVHIGLEPLASGRYSQIFVLDVFTYERLYGIEPWTIVEEVKGLEEGLSTTQTKPAAQFTREPLRDYWHKHYFCARFVAVNIKIAFRQATVEAIVAETVAAANGDDDRIATELAHRLTHGLIDRRETAGALTGEWIVFAKHEGKNFYLCLGEHGREEEIRNRIRSTCLTEFPFLGVNAQKSPSRADR